MEPTSYHLYGAGSTKGSFDQVQVWPVNGLAALGGTYVETVNGPSVGEVVGGPAIYTATTALMLTSTTNVAVAATSQVFDVNGAVLANEPTSQLQHFFIDSCTDSATMGALAKFIILPPDYLKGSTAASSLGSGVEKGMFRVYEGSGYCGTPVSFQLSSATPVGGCSNPSTNPMTSCTQSNAIAWPAGALTFEQPGAPLLSIKDSHLEGFQGATTGYTLANDNTTARTAAEAEVGFIPDGIWQLEGCADGSWPA